MNDMSADGRPGSGKDAVRLVLEAVARETDVEEIVREFGPLGRFSNGDAGAALLGVAAEALELGQFTRSDPLRYLGLRERYLPEVDVSGKNENYKSDWTLRAVAALAGGVEPGVEDQLRFWRIMDLERWAVHAVVAYVRAAADHTGQTVSQICVAVAEEHGFALRT
mgnify:CR=1 FL=1